jgi:hypothetical protein
MLKHCVQLKTGHQRPVLDLLGTRDIVPENGTVPFKTGLLVTLRAQPNSREKGANYAAVFGENVKLRGNYAEG